MTATTLDQTAARRNRLVTAITDRIRPDGSLDDVCRSRITESALLLILLRRTGLRPDLNPGLFGFLAAAHPAHPFERLVQAAVLGHSNGEATAYLAGFTHPTGERKRLLLAAILALAADAPVPSIPPLRHRGHALWTDVTLCSLKTIDDARRGGPATADQTFLTDSLHTGPENGVWQGNLLAHLLALHAVAATAPESPLLTAGVTALAGQINPDGGVPFIAGQDIWITALAGTALVRSGIARTTAEQMGRYIAACQLPDGGWGYGKATTQSDVDDTSRCMTFLAELNPSKYRGPLVRGRAYLEAIVGTDGGFPTYVRGAPSEPDLTAGGLIALTEIGPPDAMVSRAVDYLTNTQHSGFFTPSWTRSITSVTAHAVQALRRAPQTPSVQNTISSALTALTNSQNTDGGWGHAPTDRSDIISTAHALTVLPNGSSLHRAAAYLADHADKDAPPDQVGPRPIPYDYPLLAHIHVLAALNRLSLRQEAASRLSPTGRVK